MKKLSKSEKLKAFIAPKMTYHITSLDNNRIYAVYTGENIHGIYPYLYMIGDPTTLTTSVQHSHRFCHSFSIKNATTYLHTVIAALRIIKKSIYKCCGVIGHNTDAFIICGPIFLPSSLRRNMNQFNNLFVEEPNDTPR